MRKSRFLSICLLLLLCGTSLFAETVIVKADKATLRASAQGNRIMTLDKFEPVEVLESSGDSIKVKANGKTGYVDADALADSPFVSTSISGGRVVNIRGGSSTSSPKIFTLYTNYPLKVLDRKGDRVQVMDWEGDKGWAHEAYLSTDRYVIANPPRGDWINIRKGPGLDEKRSPIYPRRFMAEKGTMLKVVEEKDDWLLVEHADGDKGWCSSNIVWGWNDE